MRWEARERTMSCEEGIGKGAAIGLGFRGSAFGTELGFLGGFGFEEEEGWCFEAELDIVIVIIIKIIIITAGR